MHPPYTNIQEGDLVQKCMMMIRQNPTDRQEEVEITRSPIYVCCVHCMYTHIRNWSCNYGPLITLFIQW